MSGRNGSAREATLDRIVRALRRGDSPIAGADGHHAGPNADQIRDRCAGQQDELADRFAVELTKIGGVFHRSADARDVCAYVANLAALTGAKHAVGWDHPLIAALGIIAALEQAGIGYVADGAGNDAAEFRAKAIDAGLGITPVDFALADTGTLVLLSGLGRARSASLLPPIHVALVRRGQFLAALDDLTPILQAGAVASGRAPAAVTFITGPSRTADIEMTIVMGVHGPQQVHVLLVD